MTLSAHYPGFTNGVSQFKYRKWKRFNTSGVLVREWDEIYEDFWCRRLWPSKNPIQKYGNLNWRRSSDYYRMISQFESREGTLYFVNGPGSGTITGPLNGATNRTWDLCNLEPMMNRGGDWNHWDSNERAKATSKAYDRLREGRTSLSETLAEAVTTYRMLVQSSLTLLSTLRSIRNGQWHLIPKQFGYQFGSNGRLLRAPANAYLQYHFGWKPLMEDIYGSAVLLKKLASGSTPFLIHAKGTSVKEYSFSSKYWSNLWHFGDNVTAPMDSTLYKTGRKVTRCYLSGVVSSKRLQFLSNVGFTNPLSLAWNLIPYSFVIDWFMPIGNVLESLIPPGGVDFFGGCYNMSTDAKCHTHCQPVGNGWGPGWDLHLSGYEFLRARQTAWPIVNPYIKSPFSDSHSTTAVALLTQLL